MSDLLPPGRYAAIAREVQWGYTKNDGQQVAVTFEVVDGEMSGAEITWFGYFTEKTTNRTLESLRHCGWVGDDISELGKLDQQVDIVVGHEEWEGQWQAKVKWVNAPGAGRFKMAKPMDPASLKQFAAQMRGAARASAEGGSPRQASSPRAPAQQRQQSGWGGGRVDERNPPSNYDDSDIPF
jgi:hypothetical protein